MNREEVIAYLFDELPEEERTAFEDRWTSDSALYEEVRSVEAELLDDYARGKLAAAAAKKVELCLLASESQQSKLAFARTLARQMGSSPARQWRPVPQWVAIGLAASLIVGLAGVSLWLRSELEVAKKARGPESVYYVASLSAMNQQRGPGESQAAGRQVTIPAGAEVVRVDLELPPGEETHVNAAGVSAGDHMVWSQQPVAVQFLAGRYVARLWIPAASLPPGRYEVRLSDSQSAIAYYAFLVAGSR